MAVSIVDSSALVRLYFRNCIERIGLVRVGDGAVLEEARKLQLWRLVLVRLVGAGGPAEVREGAGRMCFSEIGMSFRGSCLEQGA